MREKLDYLVAKHTRNLPPYGIKVNLFCPACKKRLHLGIIIEEKYETLTEHVSDPNQKSPWKPIFWCLTKECELSLHHKGFFGYDGAYYGPIRVRSDCYYAIGSLSYRVEKDLMKKKWSGKDPRRR